MAQGQFSEANTNFFCFGLRVCFSSFQGTTFLEAVQTLCSPITRWMLTPVSTSQPRAVSLRPALCLHPFLRISAGLTASAHRLYTGRVAEDEAPPIWSMHPTPVESKRQLTASGSAPLCPEMTVLEEQQLRISLLLLHVCLQSFRWENSPQDTPLPMLT